MSAAEQAGRIAPLPAGWENREVRGKVVSAIEVVLQMLQTLGLRDAVVCLRPQAAHAVGSLQAVLTEERARLMATSAAAPTGSYDATPPECLKTLRMGDPESPSRDGVGSVTVTPQGKDKAPDADRAAVLAAQPWRVPAGWHGRAFGLRTQMEDALAGLRDLEAQLDRAWQAAANVPPAAPEPAAAPPAGDRHSAVDATTLSIRRGPNDRVDLCLPLDKWVADTDRAKAAEDIVRALAAASGDNGYNGLPRPCMLCHAGPARHTATCAHPRALAWVRDNPVAGVKS